MFCYDISEMFPADERFRLVSQFTRAAMSVMLNYVEGYARKRDKVKLNFYETSLGSLKECKYIIYFAFSRNWIKKEMYEQGIAMCDEIGKMLWSTIDLLEKKIGDM
jgi:four helix bundle protein